MKEHTQDQTLSKQPTSQKGCSNSPTAVAGLESFHPDEPAAAVVEAVAAAVAGAAAADVAPAAAVGGGGVAPCGRSGSCCLVRLPRCGERPRETILKWEGGGKPLAVVKL